MIRFAGIAAAVLFGAAAQAQLTTSLFGLHAVPGYSAATHAHDAAGVGLGFVTGATMQAGAYYMTNSATINLDRYDALQGATAATWMWWMYAQSSQALHAVDSVYGATTTNRGYFVGLASFKPRIVIHGVANSSIYSEVDANTALAPNQWHHIAITWPNREVYVNGVSVPVTLTSNGIPPTAISLHNVETIGRTISQQFAWTGRLFRVAKYRRQLSSNEIAWDYTQTRLEALTK